MRRAPRAYDVVSLVTGPYDRYLATYVPRGTKQRKRAGKNPLIGPFSSLLPYTITLMGYLAGELDIERLYEGLRSRVGATGEPGEVRSVVSGDGRLQLPGQVEASTTKYLSNHTSIRLQLADGARVLLRVSPSKVEVIGCKRDEDIVVAWEHLCDHINQLASERGIDVRQDTSVQLKLVLSYAAMRNYAFKLGYALDVRELAVAIAESTEETGFNAWRNPSLQTDLRVHYPASGARPTPPRLAARPAGEEPGPGSKQGSSPCGRRPSAKKRPSPSQSSHIFRVFHTGNCLYSGKGPRAECEAVFERFRSLLERVRPRVELDRPAPQ